MTAATDETGEDLGRASGVMAAGTVLSRLTGFLRVVALSSAVGINAVSEAYNVAGTLPFIVYELLLGGVLSSVLVGQLVRAAREEGDGGEELARVLLSTVTVVLGAAVLAGVVAAPWLVRLVFDAPTERQADLATAFLRFFLPQMLFFGLNATMTAILNTRGRFGLPMFASVLNNVAVVVTALVFVALPGPRPPTVEGLTTAQTVVLGAGTTSGVVAMTLALLPGLRRSGFRWRWRLRRHPALRRTARLGGWMLVYVVANQVGYAVIVKLATAAGGGRGGLTTYQYAFMVFLLPHAVVTVSVVTALQPRLAAASLAEDAARLRGDVARGLRLVAALVVPAALGLAALAGPLATVIFRWRATGPEQAAFVGTVLVAFACGLPAFSAFQLFVRTFVALQDTRTPALVNIGANAVNLTADLVLFAVLDGRTRVVGLAVGHAVAYTAGALVFARLLSRRLGGLEGHRVVRTYVRVALAGAVAAGLAWAVALGAAAVLGTGRTGALAAVALGGAGGAAAYAVLAGRMRVAEMSEVTRLVRSVAARLRRTAQAPRASGRS